jgi:hypothetical protein
MDAILDFRGIRRLSNRMQYKEKKESIVHPKCCFARNGI